MEQYYIQISSHRRNVLQYLEQSAKKEPDKTAVEDEKDSLTYRQLLEQSQQIGTALAARSDEHRQPIAVFMEKSAAVLTVFFGIVYSGNFYVMLDSRQPAARIRQILDTLGQPAVITDKRHGKALEKIIQNDQILYREELADAEVKAGMLERVREQSTDLDPLYCIFTSGSTGVPKGVLVGHRSVLDFIDEFTETFGFTADDVFGCQAPLDFDVSVKDIYTSIKTGATLELIPKQYFSFPTKLLDFLEERQVTTLIWAVSALCIITTLKGFDYKIPGNVNKVLFSGEVMPVGHLNQWQRALPDAMYVNLYGPTEITCNCTYYKVEREFEPGEHLPIGQPFPNETVMLLDDNDQLVTEPFKKGELCVAGTALALGYYGNPDQTAKAFVKNPLNTAYPQMIYRTGDLAFYNADGDLCFASRKDFQIKHMGHRIELGEIETVMEKSEGVERACVIYLEDSNKIGACYLGRPEVKALVRELRQKLPAFMIPNLFEKVDEMPLTKNGKIDRSELRRRLEVQE